MKFAVGSQEMKQIDSYTINETGIPSLVLMERAALCLADRICGECAPGLKIVAVCGNGNNGGDGVAAARILHQRGRSVSIYMHTGGRPLSGETRRQLDIAGRVGVPVDTCFSADEYTVIIDALFGIGLSRVISGTYLDLIQTINAQRRARVYAVDIPSGICADNGAVMGCAVKADVTVTFGCSKIGLLLYPGRIYAGRVFVEDIGFAPQALESASPQVRYADGMPALAPRRADSNKGDFGRVLVIAGHGASCGAAALSARAAFRMGAGLVKIMTSERGAAPVLACVPEAMVESYDSKGELLKDKVLSALSWATVVVFGMGLGTDANAQELFRLTLENVKAPLVLDADGLNMAAMLVTQKISAQDKNSEEKTAESPEGGGEGVLQEHERAADEPCIWKLRAQELAGLLPENTVLTPHIKELSRLLGCEASYIKENIIDIAGNIAYNNKLVYICKDAATVVAAGDGVYINATGNSGMSTAGSGDVLTGVIAGLLAGSADIGEACVYGVYIHGLAGDAAAGAKGMRSMMAGDIVEALADVCRAADAVSGVLPPKAARQKSKAECRHTLAVEE